MEQNFSLKNYNSFGVEAKAQFFSSVSDIEALKEKLSWAKSKNLSTTIIGGGSNLLLTKNLDGLVIHNNLKGITKIKEDDDHIYLKTNAGVVWHQFVLYCLQNNYAGVENLALIPGFAGASPMQNIGAYGVEIKEVFHELTAVHRFNFTEQKFTNSSCEFGYRESVFKNKYKNEFVITDVTYKLNKRPQYKIEYGAIRQELELQGVKDLSIQAIAKAVMAIRTSKLPDPAKIGNAGSFFKNPSVSLEQFNHLKENFSDIVAYKNPNGSMKLAAGWMVEQCGLKGYRKGDAGVHEKQALVLVNYGNATGVEIKDLCHWIIEKVNEKFGVQLSPEVNIL